MPNPPTTRFGLTLDLQTDTYDVDRTINAPFRRIEIVGALDADLQAHISATATHGATGAVVGTTNTQTLTNKTLSGVIVTGPLTLSDTTSTVVPGATSLSLRNHANNADNVLVADAGNVTIRNGVVIAAGATADGVHINAPSGANYALWVDGAGPVRMDRGGDVFAGGVGVAAAATSGFLWIGWGSAAPTGTPSGVGGVPVRFNTADNHLYAYINSTWKSVAFT